jgi:hypothetical protein
LFNDCGRPPSNYAGSGTLRRFKFDCSHFMWIAMERDIKDVIGVLMRVLDGGEVSHEELDELGFEADGELETALNEAYVKLRICERPGREAE